MALETGTYVSDLVITNPVASDLRSQGDDHLRLIKKTLQNSFPKDLRGVSSPLLGDKLTYDGTSFKNVTEMQGLNISNNGGFLSLADNANGFISFDEEILDTFGMFTAPSVSITVSANCRKFRAYVFFGYTAASIPTGYVTIELVNITDPNRQPFGISYMEGNIGANWQKWLVLGVHTQPAGYTFPNTADVLKLKVTNKLGLTASFFAQLVLEKLC